jgi:hypothetical protein
MADGGDGVQRGRIFREARRLENQEDVIWARREFILSEKKGLV